MPSHYDEIIEELTGQKPKPKGPSAVPVRDDQKTIIDNLASRFGNTPDIISQLKGAASNVPTPTPEVPAAPSAPARGPFSSLFNYEEIAENEQKGVEDAKNVEKKIARTNSIGDALSLLISGVGAGVGATVTPKGENKNILAAMDKIKNLDEASRRRLDQFKMFDLNQKVNDLKFQNQVDAAGVKRQFDTEERVAGQDFKVSQTEAAGEQDIREIESRGEQQRLTDQNRVDQGFYDYRNPATKKAIVLNGVTVTPEMQSLMLNTLQQKYAEDALKPRILKSIDRNEAIKQESVQDLFLDEWQYLAERVPELGGTEVPRQQEIQAPTVTTAPTASDGRIRRAERRAGTGVSNLTPDQYNTTVQNIVDNNGMSYRDQLKSIKDIAILYNNWSEVEAETYAKELLRLTK